MMTTAMMMSTKRTTPTAIPTVIPSAESDTDNINIITGRYSVHQSPLKPCFSIEIFRHKKNNQKLNTTVVVRISPTRGKRNNFRIWIVIQIRNPGSGSRSGSPPKSNRLFIRPRSTLHKIQQNPFLTLFCDFCGQTDVHIDW